MPGCVQVLQGVTTSQVCARWLSITEVALLEAGAAQSSSRSDRSGQATDAATVRACSVRLAALPELFDEVREALQRHSALMARLTAALGPSRTLLIDQCWVRHQPAPSQRASGQTPHSWHQDGALAFDFASSPPGPAAPLPMLTCWLPLTDCGTDAPSLAWVDAPLDHLLMPDGLLDAAVHARCAAAQPPLQLCHAVLPAGDALLFDGGLLHRTHATAAMTRARTSVELRWMPAEASALRLTGEQIAFVP